jgi:hypothetical protein
VAEVHTVASAHYRDLWLGVPQVICHSHPHLERHLFSFPILSGVEKDELPSREQESLASRLPLGRLGALGQAGKIPLIHPDPITHSKRVTEKCRARTYPGIPSKIAQHISEALVIPKTWQVPYCTSRNSSECCHCCARQNHSSACLWIHGTIYDAIPTYHNVRKRV